MILMLLNVSLKLASGRPPNKVVAELMVPVKLFCEKLFTIKACRRLSPKKYAGVTGNYAGVTGNYAGITGNYAGVTTCHFLTALCKTLRF